MQSYYGVFYKDKDGFDTLAQSGDFGQCLLYSEKREASKSLIEFRNKLFDTLNPRIEYVIKHRGFFKKPYEVAKRPDYLSDWEKSELRQKLNTLFIKQIQI